MTSSSSSSTSMLLFREAVARHASRMRQACVRLKTGRRKLSTAGNARRFQSRQAPRSARRRQPSSDGNAGEQVRSCSSDSSEAVLDAAEATGWELVISTLVSRLPLVIFAVAGQSAGFDAGPAAVISVIFTAVAVSLTGYCHCRMSPRFRRYLHSSSLAVSGPYELLYRSCCELAAALCGWLLVLQYCSSSALVTRTLALHVDSMIPVAAWTARCGSDVSSRSKRAIGEVVFNFTFPTANDTDYTTNASVLWTSTSTTTSPPGGHPVSIEGAAAVATTIPGPFGLVSAFIVCSTAALVPSFSMTSTVGSVRPKWFPTITWSTFISTSVVCLTIAVLLFSSVVSLFHGLHFENWSGVGNFFPNGLQGIIAASAGAYFVLNVYDEVTCQITSGSTRTATERQFDATLLSVITNVVLAVAIILVVSLTTLTSSISLEERAAAGISVSNSSDLSTVPCLPFPVAYVSAGMSWMKFVLGLTALTSLIPAAVLHTGSASSMIIQMSADGLLPSVLRGQIYVAIATGCITIAAAFICSSSVLLSVTSGCSLLVNLLTVACAFDVLFRPLEQPSPRMRRSASGSSRLSPRRKPSSSTSINATAADSSSVLMGTALPSPRRSSTEPAVKYTEIAEVSEPDQLVDNLTADSDLLIVDGYESGSSYSSDTDIDEAVDQFHATRLTALARHRQDDALLDVSCPDTETHNKAVKSMAIYSTSVFVASLIMAHASDPSSAASVIGIVVAAVVAAVSAARMFWLPRNDEVLTMTSSRVRAVQVGGASVGTTGVRCASLASIAVNSLLLASVNGASLAVGGGWVTLGFLLYTCYGIRHSREAQSFSHVPEEHRILLPGSFATGQTGNQNAATTIGSERSSMTSSSATLLV